MRRTSPETHRIILNEAYNYLSYTFKSIRNIMQHKVQSITLFVTNRCNSRCVTCDIWRQKSKIDLSVDIIKELLDAKKFFSEDLKIIITGGEAALHPRIEDVLEVVSNADCRLSLLSNGILSDRVVELVKKFNIRDLALSIDGRPQVNEKIRGVDSFNNVKKIIKCLKGKGIYIHLDYTISPFNSREDYIWVKQFANKEGISVGPGFYNSSFIGRERLEGREKGNVDLLYDVVDLVDDPIVKLYQRLYRYWVAGNLELPCYSIRSSIRILPNGDINLCEGKVMKLGNLYEEKLNDLWNSERIVKIQKEHTRCNKCWLSCHRGFDIKIVTALRLIFPPSLLKLLGPYDWEKLNPTTFIKDGLSVIEKVSYSKVSTRRRNLRGKMALKPP